MRAFESNLQKLGKDGQVVTQDDMLIALSRISASLTLDDIREFFVAINGGNGAQLSDDQQV